MNGGGDTPLPTPIDFKLKLIDSVYYLVDQNDNYVRCAFSKNYVITSESSVGNVLNMVIGTGKTPYVTADAVEDPETYNVTIALEGYNTLVLVYNDDTELYTPTPYVPVE